MNDQNKQMSVGDWMITMFITAIPVLGFIMLLVWAFSDGTNRSKKNWAKATLIFLLIVSVLYFIFGVVIAGILATLF